MKTRKLKLHRRYRRVTPDVCRDIPELLLCGDWLMAAGFNPGHYVEVEVLENQLIIKTIEE